MRGDFDNNQQTDVFSKGFDWQPTAPEALRSSGCARMVWSMLSRSAIVLSALIFLIAAAPKAGAPENVAVSNLTEEYSGKSANTNNVADTSEENSIGRRVDRLEDRSNDQENANDIFGILITVSGVGFASLIAIVVVVFAVRTEKVAVAAARDEIKTSVGSIQESVEDARNAAAEARRITQQLRNVLNSAEADAAQLAERAAPTSVDPGQQQSLTPEERGRLDRAAAITSGKPLRELSLPELKVRLADASERESWEEVLEIATATRVLYPSDRIIAESLNAEGTALSGLRRDDEALAKFDEVIRRYG